MCVSSKAPFDSTVNFYYTDNLDQTAQFWEEVVGLPLILDQGTCRIYQVSGDGYLGFCEKPGVSASTDGAIITLVTEEVDEAVVRLKKRGVAFEKAPAFNTDYNIYHAFFRDPNGLLIEIQRFEDPRWPASVSTGSS